MFLPGHCRDPMYRDVCILTVTLPVLVNIQQFVRRENIILFHLNCYMKYETWTSERFLLKHVGNTMALPFIKHKEATVNWKIILKGNHIIWMFMITFWCICMIDGLLWIFLYLLRWFKEANNVYNLLYCSKKTL